MDKEIVYAGDPLCAWCFGFTDVFSALQDTFKGRVRFSYVMGGLKVDSSICVCANIKDRIRDNWSSVVKRTGQDISLERICDLPEGDYNSEPPCRAVVSIRSLDPELGFSYYKAVHRAFYLGMKNISDPNCLCKLAENQGISETTFFDLYHSEAIKQETRKDFERSKKAGVLGLPALILKDQSGIRVLNQGYKPLAPLTSAISGWVEGSDIPLLV